MADSPTFATPAQAVEFLLSKHVDEDLEMLYSEVRRAVCSVLEPGERPGSNLQVLVEQVRERNKTAVRAASLLMNMLQQVPGQKTDATGMPIGAGPPRPLSEDELAVRRGARKE